MTTNIQNAFLSTTRFYCSNETVVVTIPPTFKITEHKVRVELKRAIATNLL